MKHTFLTVQWQGRRLEFEVDIHPADPDVGIMGPFVENIRKVTDDEGKDVGFTDAECEAWMDYDTPQGKELQDALNNAYYGPED